MGLSKADRAKAGRAIMLFRCPTCGARIGEHCRGKTTHKRRIAKLGYKGKKRGSVRAISAGAFESNRRRH
jgi:hypothetical protein